MSKPTTAEELHTPMDLSQTALHEGIVCLRDRLGTNSRIYFYVKASFPALIYVADDLAKYGMPAVVDQSYGIDEWSMVGIAARINDFERAEIWSPGA